MARSTMFSFLMQGTGTPPNTWTEVIPIKDYADLGGAPEALDATTLKNWARVYIEGIEETQSNLTFTCNYEAADYQTVKALEGSEKHWAVWFGGTKAGTTVTPTGSAGKFAFDGYLHVHVVGKGVNEVQEMQIDIIPTTEITFSVGGSTTT